MEVELLQTSFVVDNFGSNRTCIAIRNAWRLLVLKVWRNITLDDFFIQDIAYVQNVDALIALNFDPNERKFSALLTLTGGWLVVLRTYVALAIFRHIAIWKQEITNL